MTRPDPDRERDIDALVAGRFAAAATAIADDGFTRTTMARLRSRQRLRVAVLAAGWILAACVLLALPATHAIAEGWHALLQATPGDWLRWAPWLALACLAAPVLLSDTGPAPAAALA